MKTGIPQENSIKTYKCNSKIIMFMYIVVVKLILIYFNFVVF